MKGYQYISFLLRFIALFELAFAMTQGLGANFDTVKTVKQLMFNLVDAVVYSKKSKELTQEAEERAKIFEKKTKKLDALIKELDETLRSYSKGEDLDDEFRELISKIEEFADTAALQTKRVLEQKFEKQKEELKEEAEAYRIKALKSIETFLSSDPLPILDKRVTLKAVGGAYEARVRYTCAEKIEYEFLLDTKNVDLFQNSLEFSKFEKGLKIAVRLGKTWLKSELVPGYEKLDQYVLSSAEVSKTNTVATFIHEQSEKKFTFVYSKSETQSFIEVKYEDSQGSVDVNADPQLNKYLETEPLKYALENLTLALLELERHKMRLTKLVQDENDLLSSLDFFELLLTSSKIASQNLKKVPGATLFTEFSKEEIVQFVERLKLLGREGLQIASLFGIESLLEKEFAH
ncbi:hypothetical protein B9Q02_01605 [Candidatus Marsarchaeota G1 archaeon BE_D]|uniref:Uncharacterized protein n=2 Tax=Candidatus Marsarchaeota TaxID=1978152 RepID=A0A2R6C281_9ARCH|nr:MAG: hypothetical protein B9Q02_01605 [Candidatus Marsarchaeota G1 archaeon BE_D]PSO04856.1 MAG: hypothetical protein B9Q12_01615 [Candidatus Marsarchaeota G2 archaeon ECH_B_SAG-G06]